MHEVICQIISNRQIADRTYEMKLGFHDSAFNDKNIASFEEIIKAPGQFINVKLDGFFLRRPISICNWNCQEITIIYKAVGKGTEAMASYKAGKELSILVPLGNGFNTAVSGTSPLLVGGGVGVPPIYGLAKRLVDEGKNPKVVMGFGSANEVFYFEKFQELGITPIVTTIDGSLGVKGLVTDVISDLNYTFFYTCGPEKMLQALDEAVKPEIGGQLSFEERMGCGFGACMGCSCKTKYGNKRICKDGPVLQRQEIIW